MTLSCSREEAFMEQKYIWNDLDSRLSYRDAQKARILIVLPNFGFHCKLLGWRFNTSSDSQKFLYWHALLSS